MVPPRYPAKATGRDRDAQQQPRHGEASGSRGRGRGRQGRGRPSNAYGRQNENKRNDRGSVCRSWVANGTCRFGDQCRFAHPNKRTAAVETQQPQASQEVAQFMGRIAAATRRQRWSVKLDNAADRELWRQAWSALAIGANLDFGPPFLSALMRLPDSIVVMPDRVDIVKACGEIVKHVKAVGGNQVVLALDSLADVVEHRLIGKGCVCKDVVAGIRRDVHEALVTVIMRANMAERASRLLGRLLALLERYWNEAQGGDDDVEERVVTTWSGWREGKLEWLLNGKWLEAMPLGNVYESVEAYADTLRQLMTMLTFYWGAGAVFPKCRQRGPDERPCDQPLCAVAETHRACGRRLNNATCRGVTKWKCSRHGHDAVCERCLRRMQTNLIGAPGPRASTDVYDAVVERETLRRGGVVYVLSEARSRKPPTIEPNWRTTYRLNCAALVAVVRLSASFQPLQPNHRVEWAEIVPVNPQEGSSGDYVERAKGRLALRLLTRADLSTLEGDPDALENGLRVAVIDLQVFVPEVVSVLSTLTDTEFVDHLKSISFSQRLIGEVTADVAVREGNIETVIENALANSEIDIIPRLPVDRRAELCDELVQLAREATLDGTQLQAFTAALTSTLHCTQGPPGTGKSYLGVVLIRALDKIRTYANRANISVGPIVVLSYKNHALDELLLDILSSGNTIAEQRRNRFRWGGQLIRCGRPEDERLTEFAERSSPEEHRAQQILTDRVNCIRAVRRVLRDVRALRSAFEDESGGALLEWRPSRRVRTDVNPVTMFVVQMLRLCVGVDSFEKDMDSAQAYALLAAMVPMDNIDANEDMKVLKKLDGLQKDMEHWIEIGMSRSVFLVEKWLSGAMPPPRCRAASEGGCLVAVAVEGTYCQELHDCQYPSGCDSRRVNGLLLCAAHRCMRSGDGRMCTKPRMPVSEVCREHACRVCVREGCVPVLERIGRACAGHTCKKEGCVAAYVGEPLKFCQSHCCEVCLHLATKGELMGVKSVLRVPGTKFCTEHKCSVLRCTDHRLFEAIPQEFCKVHACVACEGSRKRVDTLFPWSKLCEKHRCSFVKPFGGACTSQVDIGSSFCDVHTCRFCRREGLPLDRRILDNPPRNVCSLHPLCVHVSPNGMQCNERTGGKSDEYCANHGKRAVLAKGSVKIQCSGIARTGKRCKTQGWPMDDDEVFYCGPHFSQRPQSSDGEFEIGSDWSDGDEHMVDAMDELLDADEESDLHEGGENEEEARVEDPEIAMPIDEMNSSGEEVQAAHAEDFVFDNEADTDEEVIDEHNGTAGQERGINAIDHAEDEQQQHDVRLDDEDAVQKLDVSDQELQTELLDAQNDERRLEGAASLNPASVLNRDDTATADEKFASDDSTLSDVDRERMGFAMCPDEVDISSEEASSDEEEMPDQLQHLRDIVGEESMSGSESEDEEVLTGPLEEDFTENSGRNVAEWSWDEDLLDRRLRVAKFLGGICVTIARLAALTDDFVEVARRERSEAAAYSFKRARLIGATVVGATRRLHAIRASEPFAMVVEEACEVLEPTLISVLAVRSLRKLELIGDHRQLPAFVQPCWFSIQTTLPSIKVSLFERLVESDTKSYSVLDVQRRMRPQICDLTRCEYADVVQIEDHGTTKTQRLADKQIKFALNMRQHAGVTKQIVAERQLWCGQGAVVPGVHSQIFFWDIESKEGRAHVGLSRCNLGEAHVCVALVKWLLQCGVTAPCITIITPFKGQKLTIIRELRKSRSLTAKDVIVSTIDRYQGDENDIVILSLVSSRPGNRFVALRNRFIVSTSRARIGFYIVGSSAAVTKNNRGGQGPLHWRRLLQDLENAPGNSAEENQVAQDDEKRIGGRLKICCPRHEGVSRDVSAPADFPQTSDELKAFCANPCTYILPWCHHSCQRSCHSPRVLPHTVTCKVRVQRPCEVHADVPLRCCDLQHMNNSANDSLTDALENYQCDVMVEYRRPECPHLIKLKCHQLTQLESGNLQLDPCAEIVEDYANPTCGHLKSKPTCHNRRLWEENPPICLKMVAHERACGCKARMTCNDSVRESTLDQPPVCLEAVLKPRPRCAHNLASRCYEATVLRELWNQQDGEAMSSSPPIVLHGTSYGPSEAELATKHPDRLKKYFPSCRVKATYRRSCGHEIRTRCLEAFEFAAGTREEDLCGEDTVFRSPICGHEIKAPCSFKALSESMTATPAKIFSERVDAEKGCMETIADESALDSVLPVGAEIKKLSGLCGRGVVIMRKCGHKTKTVSCTKLHSIINSKQLPKCTALVSVERSCGHTYDVQCCRRGDPPPICNEVVGDLFTYPSCRRGHSVRPGTCHKLAQLYALCEPSCPVEVSVVRKRCKHMVSVPCHLEENVKMALPGHCLIDSAESPVVEAGVDYCETAPVVVEWHKPVTYRRLCGHEDVDIPCASAFSWASSEDEPPCQRQVVVNSPLCNHAIPIVCNQEEAFLETKPWGDEYPEQITYRFGGDELACPVVTQGQQVPSRPPEGVFTVFKCGYTTRLQRSCGHEEDIPCETIFDAIESRCEHLERVQCQECGHEKQVRCHMLSSESMPHVCTNIVTKKCTVCNINFTEAPCFKESTSCESEVVANLVCKHPVKWICGEDDPRVKQDSEQCIFCLRQIWVDAHEATQMLMQVETREADQVLSGNFGRLSDASTSHNPTEKVPYFDRALLAQELIGRVHTILPVSCIKESIELESFASNSLLQAYCEILKSHIDLFCEAIENESNEGAFLRMPPNISDAQGAYDIVYIVLSEDENLRDCFRPVSNQYGFGARATILSTEALKTDYRLHNREGTISICVAAALRHQGLEDVKPFRPETAQLTKRPNAVIRKSLKKANKLMRYNIAAGYDHVCRSHAGQPLGRVYWRSGAVLPLIKLKVQLHRKCEICFDHVLSSKGWCCPQDHFLCRECFSGYVKQAQEPDALMRTKDGTGNLLCPQDGCEAKYVPLLLLHQEHDATQEEVDEIFGALQELKMAAHTKRELSFALDQQKRQLEADFQRIQQLQDIDDRQAETNRLKIINDVLTLKCPRESCSVAFFDFDGCFALTCGNCKGNFCAWCLDYYSMDDIHHHVANCPRASSAGYYHSLVVFNEHHSKRRKQVIIEMLRKENHQVQQRTLKLIEKELLDIRITIQLADLS